MSDFINSALNEASSLLNSYIADKKNIELIRSAIDTLGAALHHGHRIISCGNGGSMCDAMHFAEELTGRFRKNRIPLPAMAISDPAHLTCVANDFGYDHTFSRHVEAWGSPGDILLAISTSGNSENILMAATSAKQKGMKVISLIGKNGGRLKSLSDIPLIVPSNSSERIQEIHIKIIHTMIEGIERHLLPHLYRQEMPTA